MACNLCNRNHVDPPRWLGPPWLPNLRYIDCLTFLCDDRGHLLPQVRQYICKKTNHWGYPVVNAWDEDFQCCPGHKKKQTCQREIQWELEDMPRYFRCRGPLAECQAANCSILDNPEVTAAVEERFEVLRSKAPPVIWIVGYPHTGLGYLRKNFGKQLSKKLGFVHLYLESMLSSLAAKYLNYCPCPNIQDAMSEQRNSDKFLESLPADLNNSPLHVQRLVMLVKNVIWYKDHAEAFNTAGILEIIKMSFLCFSEAPGFIIDEFPVSTAEAKAYECVFWPVAAGVYFMSEKWVNSKNRSCNPRVNFPKIFLRSESYFERFVHQTVDEHGCKMVKVPYAECLAKCDICYLQEVMCDLVRQYRGITAKKPYPAKQYRHCDKNVNHGGGAGADKNVNGADKSVNNGADKNVNGADKNVNNGADKNVNRGVDKNVNGADKNVNGADKNVNRGVDKNVNRGVDKNVYRGVDKNVNRGVDKNVYRGAGKNSNDKEKRLSWTDETATETSSMDQPNTEISNFSENPYDSVADSAPVTRNSLVQDNSENKRSGFSRFSGFGSLVDDLMTHPEYENIKERTKSLDELRSREPRSIKQGNSQSLGEIPTDYARLGGNDTQIPNRQSVNEARKLSGGGRSSVIPAAGAKGGAKNNQINVNVKIAGGGRSTPPKRSSGGPRDNDFIVDLMTVKSAQFPFERTWRTAASKTENQSSKIMQRRTENYDINDTINDNELDDQGTIPTIHFSGNRFHDYLTSTEDGRSVSTDSSDITVIDQYLIDTPYSDSSGSTDKSSPPQSDDLSRARFRETPEISSDYSDTSPPLRPSSPAPRGGRPLVGSTEKRLVSQPESRRHSTNSPPAQNHSQPTNPTRGTEPDEFSYLW